MERSHKGKEVKPKDKELKPRTGRSAKERISDKKEGNQNKIGLKASHKKSSSTKRSKRTSIGYLYNVISYPSCAIWWHVTVPSALLQTLHALLIIPCSQNDERTKNLLTNMCSTSSKINQLHPITGFVLKVFVKFVRFPFTNGQCFLFRAYAGGCARVVQMQRLATRRLRKG